MTCITPCAQVQRLRSFPRSCALGGRGTKGGLFMSKRGGWRTAARGTTMSLKQENQHVCGVWMQ